MRTGELRGAEWTEMGLKRAEWRIPPERREGSRWIRQHDEPQTAYQRLLASKALTKKECSRLRDWHESLDPFRLATQVEAQLKPILRLAVRPQVEAPTSTLTIKSLAGERSRARA